MVHVTPTIREDEDVGDFNQKGNGGNAEAAHSDPGLFGRNKPDPLQPIREASSKV